ncbi:MAG: GNAT family N-acetyltransferase [Thermoproteota archaeon]|nr:GNAT family N-acetyltransferase [Thermoproteota archaeon]
MDYKLQNTINKINIKNLTENEISKVVDLQKESFADMSIYSLTWSSSSLRNHIRLFPQGQLYAEFEGRLIGSCSSLIVSLKSDYEDHTWSDITEVGSFSNHNPNGDSLYGADISVHPDFRHRGIATMLYNSRRNLAIKLNLRRIIAGGRLFDYCKYANLMSADEYAKKVANGELKDPVLSFQLKNGFKVIKILPNYLYDKRSLNYASFVEWLNPNYKI